MALVLRKAILPKNVSLLRCMRKKGYSTAAAKRITTPLAKSCKATLRGQIEKVTTRHPMGEITEVLKTKQSLKMWCSPRRCFSCTSIMMPAKTQTLLTSKHSWYNNYISSSPNKKFHLLCKTNNLPIRNGLSSASLPLPTGASVGDKVHYSDSIKDSWTACGCPGAPSCDCCDLPPPCNDPPKCLQCMTGYYHYPYGFWFCGPYNVCTGPIPCEGPVKAGGSCGPIAGPCPNFGTCGPCKPCSPCGPCAPCGPCVPCGMCALCDPHSSYAQYGHYGSNAAFGQYASGNQCGHSAVHASYSCTPYEFSYPTCTFDSSGTQAYRSYLDSTETHANSNQSQLKTEISPKTGLFASATLSSKAPKESLSSTPSMPTPSGNIDIDPSIVQNYPFNKPTYKTPKPKGSESRTFSSDCSPIKNETYE